LVFAPLIKGGNRPLPLLVLELAAIALLIMVARDPARIRGHLSWAFLATLALLVVGPLVQLVPLPQLLWESLPGREAYAAALNAVGLEPSQRTFSLLPRATESAWLALLPAVAVFLASVALPDEKLKRAAQVFIAMAVVQALIGLAQFGTGSAAVLWEMDVLRDRSGIGTYANRDHLAGLLEMALPLALALLAARIIPGHRASRNQRPAPMGRAIARMFSDGFKVDQVVLLGAASLVILLGLVFTRSRTGVALGMFAILLCALAFSRRLGGERSVKLVSVVAVVGLALAVEIGLAPVLGRFTTEALIGDLRWSIYSGTISGIGEFFPLGSGFGTYPEVFRRFQPADVPTFVNHAHNDYLEWLFEGGVVAAILIVAFAAFYVRRWPQLWVGQRWSQLRFLQVAAGISLLLLSLHGLVDFNLHIPANAIYFAFLAGVFFHREEEVAQPKRKVRAPVARPPEPPAVQEPSPPPLDNQSNPFAD